MDAIPSSLAEAALEYAHRGLPVFPCQPRGKTPATEHGCKDATTDTAAVEAVWRTQPKANIGISTDDLVVIDEDGPAGRKSLAALEAKHAPLPATLTQLTGRVDGGKQFIFRRPPGVDIRNSAGKLGDGLDVRSMGGYFIAPPSIHPTGKTYEWIDPNCPIAELPAWVVVELATPAQFNGNGAQPHNGADDGADIPSGQRDDTLFKLACKLRWAGLSFGEVLAKMHTVNGERCKPSLTDRHVVAKVEQAFKYQNQPDAEDLETHCDEEPRPLTQDIPEAEEFPIEALGPNLAPAAVAICGLVQAPPAIAGQSVLGGAALVAQPHADIELPHGQVRPTSVFLGTIADSGERKTTCDSYAMEPIAIFERGLASEYKVLVEAYVNAKAVWDKQRAQVLADKEKRNDPGAQRVALDALGPEPESPLLPVMTCPEPTYEGLVRLLRDGRPSAGLFSSEGGQFIGGFAMSTDNRLKTCAGLANLWDGKPISRVRGGDGSFLLFGRRVSMHLQMQPLVAAELFCDPLLKDQGIFSRILASRPTSLASTRMWREPTAEQIENLSQYKRRMREILSLPLPLVEDTRNELAPRVLKLSSHATNLWTAFHDKVESQLAPDGPLEGVRSLASKLAEHAARLAAVMTLFADIYATEVGEDAMSDGITLAQFYLTEALRIHRISQIDADLRLAQLALKWLQGEWNDSYVSLPDLYRCGPSQVRDLKTARDVTRILERHGWLVRSDGPIEIKGKRRRKAWRIWGKEVRNGVV